jgi:hypothetical protein
MSNNFHMTACLISLILKSCLVALISQLLRLGAFSHPLNQRSAVDNFKRLLLTFFVNLRKASHTIQEDDPRNEQPLKTLSMIATWKNMCTSLFSIKADIAGTKVGRKDIARTRAKRLKKDSF